MSDIVNIGMFFVLIAVTNLFFAMTSSNLDDIESCEVGEFLLSKNQHTTDRKFKLTDPNTNTFLIGITMNNETQLDRYLYNRKFHVLSKVNSPRSISFIHHPKKKKT